MMGLADKPLPGKTTIAKNVLKSAADFAIHFVSGYELLVPDPVLADRKEKCSGCDERRKVDSRCAGCGCYLEAKIRIASSKCPLDPPKWKSWKTKSSPAASLH